jgi:hypothetical protein
VEGIAGPGPADVLIVEKGLDCGVNLRANGIERHRNEVPDLESLPAFSVGRRLTTHRPAFMASTSV